MRHFFFASIFLFIVSASFGQVLIEGRVLDQKSKQPIPFANVGIHKSNLGTLSNEDGSFLIRISEKNTSDTLLISALGFGKRSIPVSLFLAGKDHTVLLRERDVILNTVTVTEKKEANKIFKLGNAQCKGGVITLDTAYAGRSNSLLIDPHGTEFQNDLQFPVYLTSARLRIFRNNLKSFKFRLRLNEVDSATRAPGQDLLQQSVIVESSIKSGWLDFDLSKLKLIVTQPFFLTFEQITTKADRIAMTNGFHDFIKNNPKKVTYDTVMINGRKDVNIKLKGSGVDIPGVFVGIGFSQSVKEKFTSYMRETSFGEWHKTRGIFAATATLSNQAVGSKKKAQAPCSDNAVDCAIEKMCKDFLDETGMVGMQLSVSVKSIIKLSKSLGYADFENKIPVTDSTKFRIASVSKSLSSMALVKLVSERKIDLDAPIQKYIPRFPEKKYPIKVRQCAGHLAGFRDYTSVADLVHQEHYDNATQALGVFERDTLLFKPGSKFYYSFFGWSLIGAIIESVSQKDYLTYMKENVFKPIQLHNTCGDNVRTKISNRSKFYDATGQENEFGDLSYKYAGGGLLSTASDLAKFGQAMMDQPDDVKKLLFTSQQTLDGTETGYGLGWYVGKDKNGHRYWHHSGDGFSSSSHLLIYPDDDLVFAFVANGQEGAAFDMEKVAAMFLK